MLDPGLWTRWLGIVVIDLALAGDNALVIALAVRTLPPRQAFWGRVWGTLGAVVIRLLLIGVVTYMFTLPLLQLAGGVLLVWIAHKLIMQKVEAEPAVRHSSGLAGAVGVIIIADMTMSIDNVVAVAGAAAGNLWLVLFGISLSLPLVVWGSAILAVSMNRYPWIVWVGGGILGYVAGEMIVKDPAVAARIRLSPPGIGMVVPVGLAALLTVMGWHNARQMTRGAVGTVLKHSSEGERNGQNDGAGCRILAGEPRRGILRRLHVGDDRHRPRTDG